MKTANAEIEYLTQSVTQLAQTLAQGEARRRRSERLYRWAAAAVIAVAMVIIYTGAELSNKAYAAQDAIADAAPLVGVLQGIEQSLAKISGGMQQIAQSPAIGDAGVLIQRLRQDSDALRQALGAKKGSGIGPNQQLLELAKISKVLGEQLKLINQALSSVPLMTQEMHQMNQRMGVMSYSVGSTMGRMGKWMPW